MKEYLDHTFTVSSCDMDMWGRLKPTAILNICQEVAYMHSTLLGFGFESLHSQNLAWVLSRVKVEAARLPQWRDEIRVRTWHKGQAGLFALRDYIFFDSSDQPIIRVTTSWLIINLATRRITRVDRVFGTNSQVDLLEYKHHAIEAEAERVEMPAESKVAGMHKALYSDMDVNQHVNNAKYLEWVCDLAPQQTCEEIFLSRFCINFNHEMRLGQAVEITRAELGQDSEIMEGKIEELSIFTLRLDYSAL